VHTSGNFLKAQLIGQLLGISNIAEDPELTGADVALILGNNAPQNWTAPAAPVEIESPDQTTPAPAPTPSAIAAPQTGLFCPLP
jgi:hypothetical protein